MLTRVVPKNFNSGNQKLLLVVPNQQIKLRFLQDRKIGSNLQEAELVLTEKEVAAQFSSLNVAEAQFQAFARKSSEDLSNFEAALELTRQNFQKGKLAWWWISETGENDGASIQITARFAHFPQSTLVQAALTAVEERILPTSLNTAFIVRNLGWLASVVSLVLGIRLIPPKAYCYAPYAPFYYAGIITLFALLLGTTYILYNITTNEYKRIPFSPLEESQIDRYHIKQLKNWAEDFEILAWSIKREIITA